MFFDQAMAVISNRATSEDSAALNRILTEKPALKSKFKRLQEEAAVAREALILVEVADPPEHIRRRWPFPKQAIVRLQTTLRENYPTKRRWWTPRRLWIATLGFAALMIFAAIETSTVPGLVHRRVALPPPVLRRDGRGDDGRVHERAFAHEQLFLLQQRAHLRPRGGGWTQKI